MISANIWRMPREPTTVLLCSGVVDFYAIYCKMEGKESPISIFHKNYSVCA